MSAAVLLPTDTVGSLDNSSFMELEPMQNDGIVHVVIMALMATQSGKLAAAILGTLLAFLLIAASLSPKLDHDEPAVLKPRVPLVGHIYGVMVGQTGYLLGLLLVPAFPDMSLSLLMRSPVASHKLQPLRFQWPTARCTPSSPQT